MVAEVAEADIAAIKVGTPAAVTLRALPNEPHEGKVSFIYPEMMKRRARPVRIELPNPDGKIKTGMYADVCFVGDGEAPALAVPDSAIIDSGTRQVVLVAKGEGRFEPRA